MVIPGPGEIQLIGYDPNQPPAPAASNNPPETNYARDPQHNGEPDNFDETSQQEDTPPIRPYLVTLQFRCNSIGPTNAVITCLNGDAEELINIGAELIV